MSIRYYEKKNSVLKSHNAIQMLYCVKMFTVYNKIQTLKTNIYLTRIVDCFACRSSGQQQKLQQGLEEMKQQYLMTVEKIRGWC